MTDRRVPGPLSRVRPLLHRIPQGFIEGAVVVGALVVIQAVMFSGYYRGLTSPSGDFLASYNSEALAWWRDGGMLNPPDWVPNLWGGFPAASQVQNSAWYLPTGIVAAAGWYDITGAAILQAVHVAFGGLGVYVLAKRGGFGRLASMFGLVAYSMTTGFYTEAPYIDIVRGFAYVPWILLCLSPLWPWKRWWGLPLASLLLWQAAVGIYPGVLVAIACVSIVWCIGWQVALRRPLRRYLLPLAGSAAIALALSAPKFLPQLGLNTVSRGVVEDLTVLTPATLATVVLPRYPGLHGVYSLNLLFVPAAALLLAVLVSLRRPIVRIAVAGFAAALLLAVPQSPLRHFDSLVPGIASSRFRLNDYLPVLFILGVIMAVSGVERLHEFSLRPLGRVGIAVRSLLLLLPAGGAAAVLIWGSFRQGEWQHTTMVLMATTAVVLVCVVVRSWNSRLVAWRWATTSVLVLLALASGVAHAATVVDLWKVNTVAAQTAQWGAVSGELMQHWSPESGKQRPARMAPPAGADMSEFGNVRFNAGVYAGFSTMSGYFSVHQSSSYVQASQALTNAETASKARAFWTAPGLIMPVSSAAAGLPTEAMAQACASVGECDGVAVVPESYRTGQLVYQVSSDAPRTVMANEAFYPGWHVILTSNEGKVVTALPRLSAVGSVEFDLPAGDWRVSMVYQTPYEAPARLLFSFGILLLVSYLVICWATRNRQHRIQRQS